MMISSSSFQAARALRGRPAGSFAIKRVTHAASAGSVPAGSSGTGSLMCFMSTATGVPSAWNGTAPVEQLVGDDAGLVEVGPGPDLLRHRLLGCHVRGRADGRAGGGEHLLGLDLLDGLGDAEVGDLDPAVAA